MKDLTKLTAVRMMLKSDTSPYGLVDEDQVSRDLVRVYNEFKALELDLKDWIFPSPLRDVSALQQELHQYFDESLDGLLQIKLAEALCFRVSYLEEVLDHALKYVQSQSRTDLHYF